MADVWGASAVSSWVRGSPTSSAGSRRLKTSTRSGSNLIPRKRPISAIASSTDHAGLYGTVVRERVERVGQGHDPARQRDLAAAKPGGIAASVPPLVVGQGDLLGELEDLAAAAGEDGGAHDRVRLYLLPLLVGQRPPASAGSCPREPACRGRGEARQAGSARPTRASCRRRPRAVRPSHPTRWVCR